MGGNDEAMKAKRWIGAHAGRLLGLDLNLTAATQWSKPCRRGIHNTTVEEEDPERATFAGGQC